VCSVLPVHRQQADYFYSLSNMTSGYIIFCTATFSLGGNNSDNPPILSVSAHTPSVFFGHCALCISRRRAVRTSLVLEVAVGVPVPAPEGRRKAEVLGEASLFYNRNCNGDSAIATIERKRERTSYDGVEEEGRRGDGLEGAEVSVEGLVEG
jgi:hypothetical protein